MYSVIIHYHKAGAVKHSTSTYLLLQFSALMSEINICKNPKTLLTFLSHPPIKTETVLSLKPGVSDILSAQLDRSSHSDAP